MSGDEVPTVSNPQYERLSALIGRVIRNQHVIAEMLEDAKNRMEGGETWTGPAAAEPWTEEVSGRHARLARLVDQIIDTIDERMNQVPEVINAVPDGDPRPN